MHDDNHTQAKTKKKSDFIPCFKGINAGLGQIAEIYSAASSSGKTA